MNKKGFLVVLMIAAVLTMPVFAKGAQEAPAEKEYKIAWYAPAVHPYFDSVQKGVKAFEADSGIAVHQQIGPDWMQDSQTQNVEALAAKGYDAFTIYPTDPTGANSLYEELTDRGKFVVNFGTSTSLPTTASFAVATDVKVAAMDATEFLIDKMGGKGRILNVLEVLTDANTRLRQEGVQEVVARYPGVEIVQEVGDITSIEEATEKIENALSANQGGIDGVICTGYTTTVAAAQLLSELNAGADKRISFIGIDDDPIVLEAIRNGSIDATIAQNPFGHGYITSKLLVYLLDGYTPKEGVYFINSGVAVVTSENVDSFSADLTRVTDEIISTLESVYLDAPAQ
jgi:ribose transport system substrate-binding protein